MNSLAYLRSQAAQEVEETLRFGDLSEKRFMDRIREKINDTKPYYKLVFKYGEVRVYGPRFILINKEKFTSIYEAKRRLVSFVR